MALLAFVLSLIGSGMFIFGRYFSNDDFVGLGRKMHGWTLMAFGAFLNGFREASNGYGGWATLCFVAAVVATFLALIYWTERTRLKKELSKEEGLSKEKE